VGCWYPDGPNSYPCTTSPRGLASKLETKKMKCHKMANVMPQNGNTMVKHIKNVWQQYWKLKYGNLNANGNHSIDIPLNETNNAARLWSGCN